MSYEAIKQFLKPPPEGAYTDQRLADLLCHAEDGKLSFWSCCCLAGVPTAMHALQGQNHNSEPDNPHWSGPFAENESAASFAFLQLADTDEARRAAIIPLIREEMERRNRMSSTTEHVESRESFAVLTR